ncbi:MAG TPA: type III-A CRISPR-associated RAMP protein Csm5 [bacterium]|nr:type III-A CRISPR-associated RAMP protein Csm5 [bacterium]
MSWMPKKYNIEMIVLTPVHVGSGEVADPMEYVCMQSEESDVIGYFDSGVVLKKLIDKQLVDMADIEAGNFHKIRRSVFTLFQQDESCDELVYNWVNINNYQYYKDFTDAVSNPKSNKRLEIDRMYFNRIENKYVFPGSSLKGAIRTAIMSRIGEVKKLTPGKQYRDYNEMIVGGIDKDAFKHLIVPDIFISPENVIVVKPQEIKRRKENDGANTIPKNYAEAIAGFKTETNITINEKMQFEGAFIEKFESIKGALNHFYYKEFSEEYLKFYFSREELNKIHSLKDQVNKLIDDGWAILRVGHYSHAESMTLKTLRNIKGKRIGTNDNVFGTTRTLADGKLPFGWIAIKEIL